MFLEVTGFQSLPSFKETIVIVASQTNRGLSAQSRAAENEGRRGKKKRDWEEEGLFLCRGLITRVEYSE